MTLGREVGVECVVRRKIGLLDSVSYLDDERRIDILIGAARFHFGSAIDSGLLREHCYCYSPSCQDECIHA
jgi:hypothetical protein